MYDNYTVPFLWVADNNYDSIGKEIEKIKESGSDAFCVESRVHKDFCGPDWWNVMDFVISKASSLNMNVCLLDDKHFPTGRANDAVKRNPEYRQKHIVCEEIDVRGPIINGKVPLQTVSCGKPYSCVYCAVALKPAGGGRYIYYKDVSSGIINDTTLKINLPSGYFRICVISIRSGYDEEDMFIDMLRADSVRLLINEVYEPHYKRYNGTCFRGFFSDEPRLANGVHSANVYKGGVYGGNIGTAGLAYNWTDGLEKAVSEKVKGFEKGHIVSLWKDIKGISADVRVAYMDEITRLYGENFSGQLSSWCRERGLHYASHIIEDSGAHTHTYYSAGHYFRSQKGADVAGIDVVLHQIKPYLGKYEHVFPLDGGEADPMFYDCTLAKLASSCAHIQGEKQGRALCEIFGAYGWAESSAEMVWLANHMLVRGINRFIPHAFTSVNPCNDCPPHFGNEENPQFVAYGQIIKYINEVCGRFEGYRDVIKTAVLYHAEAEWSGMKFMTVDKVAHELMQHQMDFDIIPEDCIFGSENDSALTVNGNKYELLIVPYREYLTEKLSEKLSRLSKGTAVIYLNETKLSLLADKAKELNVQTVYFAKNYPFIRVRRARNGNKDLYMFHNENLERVRLKWKIADCLSVKVTDLLNSTEKYISVENGVCDLCMEAGQAMLFEPCNETFAQDNRRAVELKPYNISACRYEKEVGERVDLKNPDLSDLFGDLPDYSGFAQVKTDIDLTGCDGLKIYFTGGFIKAEIGNESYLRVSSPAVFDLRESYGKTSVKFTLCNTLADRLRDGFSMYSVFDPVSVRGIYGLKKE